MNKNFYTLHEVKEIMQNKEKLVYVDNGIEEYVIKYKDLPDYIASNSYESNLKIYSFPCESMTPILTTIGIFLDKCDSDVRADIIDRLVKLQKGEEKINEIKLIDECILEKLEGGIYHE